MPARRKISRSSLSQFPRFVARRVGGEPADEIEHLWQCPTCDAWVDMRELGAMIEHGEPLPHPPGLPRQ
jgi:hypothetical protein